MPNPADAIANFDKLEAEFNRDKATKKAMIKTTVGLSLILSGDPDVNVKMQVMHEALQMLISAAKHDTLLTLHEWTYNTDTPIDLLLTGMGLAFTESVEKHDRQLNRLMHRFIDEAWNENGNGVRPNGG